ncbi:hypothetical protein K502DRAFT_349437 [Neoconidiobolus thromboides FSU 785]|nr:hypothetical protein K502DRAFT_349437 [Neoconidiobolus thromboides FSU 785]
MKFHTIVFFFFALLSLIYAHDGAHDDDMDMESNNSSGTSSKPTKMNKDSSPTPTDSNSSSTTTEEPWTPIDPALQASINKPKSISAAAYTPSKINFSSSSEAVKASSKVSGNAKSDSTNLKIQYVAMVVPAMFLILKKLKTLLIILLSSIK